MVLSGYPVELHKQIQLLLQVRPYNKHIIKITPCYATLAYEIDSRFVKLVHE